MKNIKKGDIINIKPEWQDEGDAEQVFRAAEDVSAEDLPYCGVYVVCDSQADLFLQPRFALRAEMIASIEAQGE